MFDIVSTAKDLIAKGQQLKDESLIKMGQDMLSQYVVQEQPAQIYKCSNCENTMDYDKPGRKKCLKCKKNTLELIEKKTTKENNKEFEFQIRKKDTSRIRYDENGQPAGKYTKAVPFEGMTNVWNDDMTDGFDEENERLKKITRVSSRTRPPAKFIEVVCSECNTVCKTHPIHASGRSKFTCDRCIRRRSKI